MQSISTYFFFGKTKIGIVFSLMMILFQSNLFAQDIGVRPQQLDKNLPPSVAAISPIVNETGFISLSIDGLGITATSGLIQVDKPVGATVRKAYFMAASTGFTNFVVPDNSITINGNGVTWSSVVPSGISSRNHFAEVTSIVKPIVDAAPSGIIDLTIVEPQSASVDGTVLVVIFDDPNQTVSNTVLLLFGAQQTTGDNFAIGLADPIDLSDPNLILDLSLGISFGFQGGPAQFSQIDVNGARLTTAAGGQDDGLAANGALITVGGIGDSNDNPADPFALPTNDPRSDDELYNLLPFVNNGDVTINVATRNPSNDDNIFFAALFLGSSTAIVGEGILLAPVIDTNQVGTNHTVVATVQDDGGSPISGRTVNFEIIAGPHAGQTGSSVTNASGQASFTWMGTNTGTDQIIAFMTNSQQVDDTSNVALKIWVEEDGEPDPFPFMTFWAVNDEGDGKLYWFTLSEGFNFSNIEGDILGIQGAKDIEDLVVDSDGNIWIMNNVGTSTLYMISPNQLDKNPVTPVTAVLVGSTGLTADGPGEIASMHFQNGTLYGIGKETKKVYEISTTDGSLTEIGELDVDGDFRTDGLTLGADGVWYLIKTFISGVSELWKFDSFPAGELSMVTPITTSVKVEALTAHPNGNLYASDDFQLFEIDIAGGTIGALSSFSIDIEGMDFFFEAEEDKTPVPTLAFTIVGAVPVELTSFTFSQSQGVVTLSWATSTETNNKGFSVERAGEDGQFQSIAFVEGKGTTTSQHHYTYADRINASGGIYSYRLKQIDYDGTFSYSRTIEVELAPIQDYALAQNYPNPFNPSTTIRYTIPQSGFVKLSVLNALGETVSTLVNENIEAGVYEVTFDASGLSSGVYIYRLETGGFVKTQKMMLMK
jgi:hypothetical protein